MALQNIPADAVPLVVWVDDDLYLNHPQIQMLELRGVEVKQFASVDEAVEYVRCNEVRLVVTDIMLPTGKLFDSAGAHGGLRTGLLFARYLRRMKPGLNLLAYTVVGDPETEDWFSNQRNCWFAKKTQYPGMAVCDLIISILENRPLRRMDSFRRALEAVDLKPGVFGISVDLKKLGRAAIKALRRT